MTAPVRLPIIGKVRMGEISKEKLLEFWQGVIQKTGLKIHFSERMEAIRSEGGGFVVRTSKQEYRTRCVLLAIGRRGTPRKLEVPGEEQPKVVYRLIDPEQYRRAVVQRSLKAVGTYLAFARGGKRRHLPLVAPTLERALRFFPELPETAPLGRTTVDALLRAGAAAGVC